MEPATKAMTKKKYAIWLKNGKNYEVLLLGSQDNEMSYWTEAIKEGCARGNDQDKVRDFSLYSETNI